MQSIFEWSQSTLKVLRDSKRELKVISYINDFNVVSYKAQQYKHVHYKIIITSIKFCANSQCSQS